MARQHQRRFWHAEIFVGWCGARTKPSGEFSFQLAKFGLPERAN